RVADGLSTSRGQRVGIAATSTAIAVAIIGAANLAFLLGYYGFLRSLAGIKDSYALAKSHDALWKSIGFTIGIVLALALATRIRTALRSRGTSKRESWWSLLRFTAALAILGLLWGFVELRDRVATCRAAATYYAARVGLARDPESAAHFARMKR